MSSEAEHCKWCGGDVAADAGPCPLSFECPTCRAKPGQWCKRPSEHEAAELHADRLALEFKEADERAAASEAEAVNAAQLLLWQL